MKTSRHHCWIFLLLFPIACLVPTACGRSDTPRQTIPGGFAPVEKDEFLPAVAEFAVARISQQFNEPLALQSIVSAERQVVAGLNYRLELDLIKSNQPLRVRAVIWRKLDGTMELTSWNPS